jgi:hypothetical protein
MQRLGSLISLTAVVLALAVMGAHESSFAARECRVDPVTGDVRCWITADPAPDAAVTIGGGGEGARLPLQWVRVFFAMGDDQRFSSTLTCGTTDGAGNTESVGAWYWVALINTETGEQVYLDNICVLPGEPLPAPPSPPPSPGEFREAAVGLLRLETSLNPRAEFGGITGVETWLWCVDPGAVPVTVGPLRGWTATASMVPVEFYWRVEGVESWSESSTSCGSEADPPATRMPERMGDYTMTGGATWAGTWILAWNGTVLGTFVLGPFDFDSAPVAYAVDEFVGELKPDPRVGG